MNTFIGICLIVLGLALVWLALRSSRKAHDRRQAEIAHLRAMVQPHSITSDYFDAGAPRYKEDPDRPGYLKRVIDVKGSEDKGHPHRLQDRASGALNSI